MLAAFRDIKSRFDSFLLRHPFLGGSCEFRNGPPPVVYVSVWRYESSKRERRMFLTQQDATIVSALMSSLVRARRNLAYIQPSVNPLAPAFEIQVKNYYPFMDKQPELDLFSPFGGNASPPDHAHRSEVAWRLKRPYPWHFAEEGPPDEIRAMQEAMERWMQEAPRPRVIFKDVDPGLPDGVFSGYFEPERRREWQTEFSLGLCGFAD